MRIFNKIKSSFVYSIVATVLGVIMLGLFVPTAGADQPLNYETATVAANDRLYGTYVTVTDFRHPRRLQQDCPKGFDRVVEAELSVPPGKIIGDYQEVYLDLRGRGSDSYLSSGLGNRVDRRHVEFSLFPEPGDKIKIRNRANSAVHAMLEENTRARLVVSPDECASRTP